MALQLHQDGIHPATHNTETKTRTSIVKSLIRAASSLSHSATHE